MKKKIKDLTFEEIISIHNLSFCNECPLKDNNGDCIRTGVTYNFDAEFLEKEIEIASSNFSECIKEWEERGYKIRNYDRELIIESEQYDLDITICKANLIYEISNYYRDKPACISPDLHHLLSKTLKALEEMKND